MTKIGRNQACPCGSGQKYKKCHGVSKGPLLPAPEVIAGLLQKRTLAEFQRKRQQGYGRGIISAELNGWRFVAVGNKIAYGHWKTFPDFLFQHIKSVFGQDWGNAEMATPEERRHPVIVWYQQLCRLQEMHITPGTVSSMPIYGAAQAYLGLAYDLYTLEHHLESEVDRSAFNRLVARLRHADQFYGARYEARVAAFFLRAGFTVKWEDERDAATRHGEFTASFPETSRSFWVECKMRQPGTSSSSLGKFAGLVSDALRKATDLERMVFVELNTPIKPGIDQRSWGWRDYAVGRLRILEGNPSAASLPRALVFVTNYPEQYYLDELIPDAGCAIEGFKMDTHRLGQAMTIEQAVRIRDANIEIEALIRSMGEHTEIPSTFDGSIPGLDNDLPRLIIGNNYELGPGTVGTLTEACVMKEAKKAITIMRLEDGNQCVWDVPLSDAEIAAWERYPETFFGVMKDSPKPISSALDLYDFFHRSYEINDREKLLELMKGFPDFTALRLSSRAELLRTYCIRMTEGALAQSGGIPLPPWINRLRPPPM
jgi:hypothetical protein